MAATKKTTTLKGHLRYETYYDYRTFSQYTAENGNSIYVVDGRLSTKENGNEAFSRFLKEAKNCARKDETTEFERDKDIAQYLMSGYDPYVDYIDDGKQYKRACESNDEIMRIVGAFTKAAGID